jgi:hypothetical protein
MTVDLHRWDAEAVQMSLWDGLTRNGNLTHLAIRHIENAMAEVLGSMDCLAQMDQMQTQMAKLTKEQARLTKHHENRLRRCWLVLGDLRYMRPPSSRKELEERADAWREEHVRYAGPERRRRGERRRRRRRRG